MAFLIIANFITNILLVAIQCLTVQNQTDIEFNGMFIPLLGYFKVILTQ